jgi:hypothetical protein
MNEQERIPVGKCRSLLGSGFQEVSEDEILEIRDQFYTLADVIIQASTELGNLDEVRANPIRVAEVLRVILETPIE